MTKIMRFSEAPEILNRFFEGRVIHPPLLVDCTSIEDKDILKECIKLFVSEFDVRFLYDSKHPYKMWDNCLCEGKCGIDAYISPPLDAEVYSASEFAEIFYEQLHGTGVCLESSMEDLI